MCSTVSIDRVSFCCEFLSGPFGPHSGVCEKDNSGEEDMREYQVSEQQIGGWESSSCSLIAWPRLVHKECVFHRHRRFSQLILNALSSATTCGAFTLFAMSYDIRLSGSCTTLIISLSLYIYIYICTHVCVYIYIYIYMMHEANHPVQLIAPRCEASPKRDTRRLTFGHTSCL